MKNNFLAILLLASTLSVSAQSYTGTARYNKTDQPALVLQLPYSQSIAEDFILDNLKKTGYDVETKGKLFWKKAKLDGYYIFKGVMLNGLNTPIDLYFKADQRSRKVKDQSTIYMMASRGDENFVTTTDTTIYSASNRFLNGFVDQSAAYKLNLDVQGQEAAIKEAEKKLTRLQEDEKDLTKKIRDLEEDLKKNKSDQEAQVRTLEEERRKLEDLRAKKTL